MSNVVELHGKDRSLAEASVWVARLDRGLSHAEEDEIVSWMAADLNNETALMQLSYQWDQMDSLGRLAELFPRAGVSEPRHSQWRMAAASILLAVLVGLGSALFSGNLDFGASQTLAKADVDVYETAVGGLSRVQLSDGSRLVLNTNSHIETEFSADYRIIRLKRGELHIDVARDTDRPLSVIVGNRILQAIGTAFSVKIDDTQQVELLVTEGKVKVGIWPRKTANTNTPGSLLDASITGDSISVSQGERIVLDDAEEQLEQLPQEEIEVQLSWREGNLIFRGQSLQDATKEISRYTPIEFVLLDEKLEKIRVAGLFKAGDVAGFLSSLEANFDIAYERIDQNTIELSTSTVEANQTIAPEPDSDQ